MNYWELSIFISPEKIQQMASDCGDSYNDDNREKGFGSLIRMSSLMIGHGCPFVSEDKCSFGSKKTIVAMDEMMEKGISIIVDPQGEIRVTVGDALLSRRKEKDEWELNFEEGINDEF